jgi:hypothetical protein
LNGQGAPGTVPETFDPSGTGASFLFEGGAITGADGTSPPVAGVALGAAVGAAAGAAVGAAAGAAAGVYSLDYAVVVSGKVAPVILA